MENELLNAAAIAEEAGVPRSTVGKWISSKRLVAVQETQRGNRVSRLFRRIDAQPLIDAAKARRAQSSEAIGGALVKTAPLLRIRPDGTPEMLVAGTLADGPRYEASAEAARAWAA